MAGSKPFGLLGPVPPPGMIRGWTLGVGVGVQFDWADRLDPPDTQGGVGVGVQFDRADRLEPPETQGGVGVGVQSGRLDALEPLELHGTGVAVLVAVGVVVGLGALVLTVTGTSVGVFTGWVSAGGGAGWVGVQTKPEGS